jgi:hypothetical protein
MSDFINVSSGVTSSGAPLDPNLIVLMTCQSGVVPVSNGKA